MQHHATPQNLGIKISAKTGTKTPRKSVATPRRIPHRKIGHKGELPFVLGAPLSTSALNIPRAFAFFIVGATILTGRWLLGWQMRGLERTLARRPGDGDTPGPGRSDGDTREPPRG
jgi:hypothetical protein